MNESQSIKHQTKNADIAIVGGGMVGMSLALMLAKKSCADNIVLIEPGDVHAQQTQDWSASFDDRSTALSAGTITIFKQLDVWPALHAHLSPINTVKVSDRGHLGFTQYSRDDNAGDMLGAVVENHHLGRALLSAVTSATTTSTTNSTTKNAATIDTTSAIRILDKTSVSSIHAKSGHMDLTLTSEEQNTILQADLVVLADGARSKLATNLGIQFDQHSYDQHALIANIAHSKAHEGRAFECFNEQGPLALLPLTDFQGTHRSALVWTNPTEKAEAIRNLDKPAFLKALQKQFGYRLGVLTDVGEVNTYPINLSIAKEQVRSSLVLMGNAAHFLHPVAGQGFNLAVRDCAELCRCIFEGKQKGKRAGDLQILQGYLKVRELDQQLTTNLSHSFIKMFASSHPLKQVSRNAALVAMHKFGPLRAHFFSQMMGKTGKGMVFS